MPDVVALRHWLDFVRACRKYLLDLGRPIFCRSGFIVANKDSASHDDELHDNWNVVAQCGSGAMKPTLQRRWSAIIRTIVNPSPMPPRPRLRRSSEMFSSR